MRAMLLMIMEVSALLFASIGSSMVYMLVTMFFFDTKINYPKACVIKDDSGDFIIENLAELEMFYTVWSPAILSICIMWPFIDKDLLIMREITAVVTVQAVIPFFQCV